MANIENTRLALLADVDLVVSVGSVDGILTTAALLRIIESREVEVCFTQAFTVDRLPVASWKGRRVAFVDLAVNNRDPDMTRRFIAALREGNNTLVAVIDEHNREDWLSILGSFDGLAIRPQSQDSWEGAPKSSGEVLRRAIDAADVSVDNYTLGLLQDADEGDRMNFTTYFGGLVNRAVKSDIGNDARRVYLAKHFAKDIKADETICGWIAEYDEILLNHAQILDSQTDLGDNIVRAVTVGKKVDMTTLMAMFYRGFGCRVVVLEAEVFNKALGHKTKQIALGTNFKGIDLLAIVKAVVPAASGFAQKVNIDPEHEEAALNAIRVALAK